jgi:hypothetical protein
MATSLTRTALLPDLSLPTLRHAAQVPQATCLDRYAALLMLVSLNPGQRWARCTH